MTTNSSANLPTGASGTILRGQGLGTASAFSTSTYPATNAVSTLLYASSANVMAALATADSASLVTNSTGVPAWTASMTNGQILIGSTSATPAPGTITSSSGLIVTPGAATLAIDLPVAVPGLNLLFNGGFQVWQRGTSIALAASTTAYTSDRWLLSVGANVASTVAQEAGALSGSYYCRVQRNSGQTGTAVMYFSQSLTRDMSIGAAGNKITVQFTALCGANFSPTGNFIDVYVYSGTGSTDIQGWNGAFSGSTAPISAAQAITTSATTYTFTSTNAVPSSATQLCVQFNWTPTGTAGANDWVEFTNVSLTISPAATNYQAVSYAEEMIRCQYFYQNVTGFTGIANGSTSIAAVLTLSPLMRVIPTLGSTGNLNIVNGVSSFTQSSQGLSNINLTNSGGLIQISNFSGLSAGGTLIGTYSSAYITLSAEL